MKVIEWIAEKVISRVATIIGGLIVSKVESDSILAHADMLENVESRAKQLESEGNAELAKQLRMQASELSLEKPGQNALKISANLEVGQTPEPVDCSIPTRCITKESESKTDAPKKKRGRPRKQPEQM